ncbi:acyltransferase family protein [Vibrio vulnificus]|nr:acyltransferase family protein [Vibrio vulnificus]
MERSSSIDALKVILFLSVVLGHISTPFYNYIYAFHIPAFFFLSGFLMKRKTLSDIKLDFVKLIIPFMIFSIFGLIVEFLKRLMLGRDFPELSSMLYDVYINFDSTVPYYGFVLWFLPILFLSKVITRCLLIRIDNMLILSLTSFIMLFFYVDYQHYFPSLFGIDKLLVSVPFVLFGFLYKDRHLNKSWLSFSISFSFVGLCVLYSSIPYFDIGSSKVVYAGVSILFPIFFVTALLSLFEIFEDNFFLPNQFLVHCGSFSMLFFVFHPYTNNIAHLVVNFCGSNYWLFKFILSVLFLSLFCVVKVKKRNLVVFKYV